MSKYNSFKLYNNKINYNSSADVIMPISDSGKTSFAVLLESNVDVQDVGFGIEDVSLVADVALNDVGLAQDSMSVKNVGKYNHRKLYNGKWDKGGAGYNSYKPHVVMVEDSGAGVDELDISFDMLEFGDSAKGTEIVSLLPVDLSFSDNAHGIDLIDIMTNVVLSDSGAGVDELDCIFKFDSSCLIVTSNGRLEPLGIRVTGDSRREILPAIRENTEEIPGRHGEIDFGSELKARILELSCVTDDGLSATEKAQLERSIAKHLSPLGGVKSLVFNDDLNKTWTVKCAGNIMPDLEATWFRFVIPFKMNDPFIIGTREKTSVGNGILVNEGTYETGLTIEITGPATNPTVTIDGKTLKYTGDIPNEQKLIIDTGKQTAKIGNNNVLDKYNGTFPLLYPGEIVVVADNNVTIKWRDKWI